MNIIPMFDNVIIKPTDKVEKTKGGVYIPENSKAPNTTGTVVATGPGIRGSDGLFIGTSVSVNDLVIYENTAGREVVVEGQKYIVLKETDIYGVLK